MSDTQQLDNTQAVEPNEGKPAPPSFAAQADNLPMTPQAHHTALGNILRFLEKLVPVVEQLLGVHGASTGNAPKTPDASGDHQNQMPI
jgi:hypothetical protein